MWKSSFFLLLLFQVNLYGSVWNDYKNRFITFDGRIVDYQNNSISHSEGQGYGMILALMYNDKRTFDLIWRWTKDNIQVRKDKLFAWKWGKRYNNWTVIDYNNATDGDILISYALLKAYEKWNQEKYKKEALDVLKDIKEHLSVSFGGHKFLLPGYYGFFSKDYTVLNPSYYVFPAFDLFSKYSNGKFWQQIYEGGLWLLSNARFGLLGLPADWVVLKNNGVFIFKKRSIYFGYEAIRIPLYLCVKGEKRFFGTESILDCYERFGYIPLWIDLVHDSISIKDAPASYYAIYAKVARILGKKKLSEKLQKRARERLSYIKDNYYFLTLYLLAQKWK